MKRAHNVILKGIPESQGSTSERIVHDERYVGDVLLTVLRGEPGVKPIKVVRIGKALSNRPRLVKATFSDTAVCRRIFRSKNKLSGTQFRGVSIQDDKTPKQIAHLQEVRNELKRRVEAGEVSVTIKYVHGIPTIVSSASKNQITADTQTGVSCTQT